MWMHIVPDEDVWFCDEAGANMHTSDLYRWAPKNVRPCVHVATQRGQGVPIEVAMSAGGDVGHDIQDGAYNAARFKTFLVNKLLPYMENLPPRPRYLIADNVGFHHAPV